MTKFKDTIPTPTPSQKIKALLWFIKEMWVRSPLAKSDEDYKLLRAKCKDCKNEPDIIKRHAILEEIFNLLKKHDTN